MELLETLEDTNPSRVFSFKLFQTETPTSLLTEQTLFLELPNDWHIFALQVLITIFFFHRCSEMYVMLKYAFLMIFLTMLH